MALTDLLAQVLEFVLASPQNAGLAALLLVVGHHVRKGAAVGAWLSYSGVFAMLLGLAVLLGVLDANIGVLQGIVELGVGLVRGFL